MIERFNGEEGRRRLVSALLSNRLVCNDPEVAEAVSVVAVTAGHDLITQGAADNDIYFILTGTFGVMVGGTLKAKRSAGSHVGEMAAINPSKRRSATVTALEPSVVATLSEASLTRLANDHPIVWRRLALELAERLEESNRLVRPARSQIKLFVISASEALKVARSVEEFFKTDSFVTQVWDKGVFAASSYPTEALDAALNDSDFALAITHGEDEGTSRGQISPIPRDNVLFELGFFMGKLGRRRTFILKPREVPLKLPSDLSGLTMLVYRSSAMSRRQHCRPLQPDRSPITATSPHIRSFSAPPPTASFWRWRRQPSWWC
jgi:CRP/FNR family transcriptional regulator, cyclic AMP receptor protein